MIEDGARPVLYKCATKSNSIVTDTGKAETLARQKHCPMTEINLTSFDYAHSYCALDENAGDASMSCSTVSLRLLGDVDWHCRWFTIDPWSRRPEVVDLTTDNLSARVLSWPGT